MGVALSEADVQQEEWNGLRVAYGAGVRPEEQGAGALYRFWVARHGSLALYAAQLGPGLANPEARAAGDRILRSLTFPEVMPPTPEEFRQRVLEILANEYPQYRTTARGEWGIDVADTTGAPVGIIGLENLFRTCLVNAEAAGALIRGYLDQVLASFSGARPGTREYDDYAAVRERLMPQLKSEAWVNETAGGAELIRVEFAPGLLMCFAIDSPTRMAYVTRDMLAKWDVPLERVQGVAQDNLAAKSQNTEATLLNGEDGRPYAAIINTQDGYDATRLALPSVRENFAAELGDEYLVGLPNRDFLVAFSARNLELAAGIIRQIRHDYHQMNHPITETIYRVSADFIEPADL
jgi:uncharacterized protein YtpQ (UPF0354 family)